MQLRWSIATMLALTPFIVTVASAFAFPSFGGMDGLIIYVFGGWIAVLLLSALLVKGIALCLQRKDPKVHEG